MKYTVRKLAPGYKEEHNFSFTENNTKDAHDFVKAKIMDDLHKLLDMDNRAGTKIEIVFEEEPTE